jgi:hypothetical protein
MKGAKLNWFPLLLPAIIIALSMAACSKDTSIVPAQDAAKFELMLPASLEQAIPQEEITGYLNQLTEMDLLTPEGYKLVPFQFALDVDATSYYDGADAGSPFAVTITGTGFDAELGVIQYFERMDMMSKSGILEGEGRIVFQEPMTQSCVPDDPTIFFRSFPTEVWTPLPQGNYQVTAPVLIKGGLEEYEGVYGEGSRNITFIEGMFDKGSGYFLGYVFVPGPDVR